MIYLTFRSTCGQAESTKCKTTFASELACHFACSSCKHFEAHQSAVTQARQPQVCERKVSQHGSLTRLLLITWGVTVQSCTQNQLSMSHIADSSSALLPSTSHSSFEPPLHSPLLRVKIMSGMQHSLQKHAAVEHTAGVDVYAHCATSRIKVVL